jgi:chromosomal replication initiator protein
MEIENTASPENVWRDVLEIIKSEISLQNFNTWFNSTTGTFLDDGTLKVSVPNRFAASWIEGKFSGLVAAALETVLGSSRQVEFIVRPIDDNPGGSPEAKPVHKAVPPKAASPETHLNSRYVFDSFVVGDSNRFARAAALAVAEAPMQTKYNPLYIYGGVGLGKTHLLQAIGNSAREKYSTLRVLYVTSEKFTNDFIEAIARARTSDFARFYRGVDLLLLDDIQFLTGKEATQEQFFHTFNALYQAGKQIVLTSDRTPREIKGLEERLLSRFQCGLVTDIQPPDLETRIAILNKMVESERLSVPHDVITYIAGNITKNIRELEGSIIRLLAYGSLTRKEIDSNLAYEVLKKAFTNGQTITIDSITNAVCNHFNLQPDQLKSRRKTADLVRARQMAMFLCRKYISASLKAIGERFGGRDHSTVIHALNSIAEGIKIDLSIKSDIDKIEGSLQSQ